MMLCGGEKNGDETFGERVSFFKLVKKTKKRGGETEAFMRGGTNAQIKNGMHVNNPFIIQTSERQRIRHRQNHIKNTPFFYS